MNREYIIDCKKEETILDALRRQGITIKAFCNGKRKCGKCRILIDNGSQISDITYPEIKLLTEDENAKGIRLACFAGPAGRDIDSLRVTILDELFNNAPILTGTEGSDIDFSSDTATYAAFDIGTTTLAVRLAGRKGELYTGSRQNSQCSFGADVISRSEASIKGKGKELSACLKKDIDSLIDELPMTPEFLVMAGNTTMIHLLMGYPLDEMVNFPFKPHYSGWHRFTYKTGAGEEFPCIILPNLSAYIGGDIVSGLYYCDFSEDEEINLFVDLGTNGEMAIGNRKSILTASAAAGPAFEGTHINVATDVVKCMADLRKRGMIDENGSLKDPYFDSGYPFETEKGCIIISQRDIRDIQMAKSAIRSGIMILMKEYGADESDIHSLYLAGGMGHGLDIESAVSIGLIPEGLKDKAVPVGNASLGGCIKYGSLKGDKDIDEILKVSSEIILSNVSIFSSMYYEYMMF